jgi:hypothetical protein
MIAKLRVWWKVEPDKCGWASARCGIGENRGSFHAQNNHS